MKLKAITEEVQIVRDIKYYLKKKAIIDKKAEKLATRLKELREGLKKI